MVKADLINRAMETTTRDSLAARDAVHAVFESVASALVRGDRVVLRQFSVFHTAARRKGVARSPRTGAPVGIPRGRVVRFRPATDLHSLRPRQTRLPPKKWAIFDAQKWAIFGAH